MNAMAGASCSVCGHAARVEIDKHLVDGVRTTSDLARSFSLSRQALLRHKENHVTKAIRAAAERDRQDTGERHEAGLLDQARDLHRKALGLMAKAYQTGDIRTAIAGLNAATKLLELQGRFLGQIGGDTTVNIAMNDFRTLQVGIVAALEPYPDAKRAVLLALGNNPG